MSPLITIEPRLLAPKQAAPLMGVSVAEVHREIARGHLDATNHGRRVLITRESVDQWIDDTTERARRDRSRRSGLEYLRRPAGERPSIPDGPENRGVRAFRAALGLNEGGMTHTEPRAVAMKRPRRTGTSSRQGER